MRSLLLTSMLLAGCATTENYVTKEELSKGYVSKKDFQTKTDELTNGVLFNITANILLKCRVDYQFCALTNGNKEECQTQVQKCAEEAKAMLEKMTQGAK